MDVKETIPLLAVALVLIFKWWNCTQAGHIRVCFMTAVAGKGPAQRLFLCSFLSPRASGRAEQTSHILAEPWARSTPLQGALQWLRLMSGSSGCDVQLDISCLTCWFCLLVYETVRAVHPPLPLSFLYIPTGEVTTWKKTRGGGKKILWGIEMDKCNFPFTFHKSRGNPLYLTQKL